MAQNLQLKKKKKKMAVQNKGIFHGDPYHLVKEGNKKQEWALHPLERQLK